MYQNLIETPGVFTGEVVANRKSLEAYNLFISGWVITVYHYNIKDSENIKLKADVKPFQHINDKPHAPWVAFSKKQDTIPCSHCSCMAALCRHIAGLPFKIEAEVCVGYTKTACTDESCQ